MRRVQRWRKIKIDPLDTLYSKIIRFGRMYCQRCGRVRDLQCAHIMGRGNFGTRIMLKPVRNAVPLCADCHDWFDTHKMTALIRDPGKRIFSEKEESFTWLTTVGYSWKALEYLLVAANNVRQKLYPFEKEHLKKELKEELRRLENESA